MLKPTRKYTNQKIKLFFKWAVKWTKGKRTQMEKKIILKGIKSLPQIQFL